MGNKPFVSIIMPVYNCEKEVCRTIESIQKQTMQEWELIVVDDCSTDTTCDVVSGYAKKDSRIILIQKEVNSGPGNSKNIGLELAKGKYVTFCDGDDWIEEDMLSEMSMNKSVCEDVIIAGYYRDICDVDDELLERSLVNSEAFVCSDRLELISRIPIIDQQRLFSYAWNKLYRTAILKNHNVKFSDKKFGEDFDFNIAFFSYAESAVMLKRGYYHYIKKNTESLTERFVPEFFEINRERFARMKSLMMVHSLYSNEIRQSILNAYIKHVLAAISRLHDTRGNYSLERKRAKVKEMLSDEMSKEALKYSKANSLKEKICNTIFKTNNITINLSFGKVLWFMQTKGKKMYERVK